MTGDLREGGRNVKKKNVQMIAVGVVIIVLIAVVCFLKPWKKTTPKQEATETKEQISEKNTERLKQASENGTPEIVISSAKAKPGEKVKINVSIVNNPGVLGMSFVLSYDETALKLVKAENGEAVKDVLDMSQSKELTDGCIFLWDGEQITSDETKDGEILNLEFEVLNSAPEGKTPIRLIGEEDGVVDNDLKTVELAIDDGYVSIEK